MTKKDKQLRDKSGKFASSKPIALYDKNGNVAYFTKEELNGFKNPDCEPATKGFVKCLMRKYTMHQHEPNGHGVLSELIMIIGWSATLVLIVTLVCAKDTTTISIANAWLIPTFLFSVICTLLCYELNYICTHQTTIDLTEHKDLKRHTPPTCEKKDECE